MEEVERERIGSTPTRWGGLKTEMGGGERREESNDGSRKGEEEVGWWLRGVEG